MSQKIRRLGLIAGGGFFPSSVVDYCNHNNIPVVVAGLRGFYDASLKEMSVPFFDIRLGNIGTLLKKFRDYDVSHIICVGHVKRPSLLSLFPDKEGVKLLKHLAFLKGGDDELLRRVRSYFEKEGFQFLGVHEVVKDLVFDKKGLLEGHIDDDDLIDIQKGISVLDALSPFDVGQSVVVCHEYVVGVEDFEGTDALLKRCARYKGAKGSILIKKPKIAQDLTLDMPSIGVQTIEGLIHYGIKGLAVEAGRVLVEDLDKMCALAKKHNVFIYFF